MPQERLFAGYLLSSLLLAAAVYWVQSRRIPGRCMTLRGFWQFITQGQAYTHVSARQDYALFVMNAVLFYALLAPLLRVEHGVAQRVYQWALLGWGEPVRHTAALPWVLAFTVAVVVCVDFAAFFVHWCFHRVPWLWQFHKVHHSAQVLNPLTLHRIHPLELAAALLLIEAASGVVYALFAYWQGTAPMRYSVLGLNALWFVFYLCGYNLRHSHIWLPFPRGVMRWVLSPAQHQIHHSVAVVHRNKNFGLMLACWDRCFGTLYVPKQQESLQFGLAGELTNVPVRCSLLTSVWTLYWQPFRWTWRECHKRWRCFTHWPASNKQYAEAPDMAATTQRECVSARVDNA